MERSVGTEPAPSAEVRLVPNSVATLLDEPQRGQRRRVWFPTGFDPLDQVLGGGIRAQELAVVGGGPGVGKTTAALQWARAMATGGTTAIFVSYEHDERDLLIRLLTLEVRELVDSEDIGVLEQLEDAVERVALGLLRPETEIAGDGWSVLSRGVARLRSYASRLLLVRGSGAHTRVPEFNRLVSERAGEETVLFVDYLQKVPNGADRLPGVEHIAGVANGLKELALSHDVGVVAVSSTDHAGLSTPRARLHHMRGAEAIAYEADVVVMLNDKRRAVSKAHRNFDSVRARSFGRQVVFSVEKNRRGKPALDLEFEKDFEHFRFEPRGAFVAERLVDDLLDET